MAKLKGLSENLNASLNKLQAAPIKNESDNLKKYSERMESLKKSQSKLSGGDYAFYVIFISAAVIFFGLSYYLL